MSPADLRARAGIPVGAALLIACEPARTQARVPSLFEPVGAFAVSQVGESSGVAVSRRHAGVIWTHNDSGDDAVVYATTLAGQLLSRHRLSGVQAVDWEDIALAPCPHQPGDCLYIADTGDNHERRRVATLYVVPEPEPAATREGGTDAIAPAAATLSVWITYPDGAHDVEAIWVDPKGAVELITKGTSGPIRRYRIPRSALKNDTVVPEARGILPIVPDPRLGRLVTGGAMSPSGTRVALRTYTEIFFFRLGTDGELAPDGPPCWLSLREPQGEAVDFLDDRTLVLTSESGMSLAGTIHRVRC
jgi:hypothetical protein